MGSDPDQVFRSLKERLSELETHVEEHDVAHADSADIAEFEAMFFSLARDILRESFSLEHGFTYEEAGSLIEGSQRSAPLRSKGTKIANLLNTLEYAPDRSYHAIDSHLRELSELIDLALEEPRIKRVEAVKEKRGSIFGLIARATSIFWFPFRWAYLVMSRKRRERKVDAHETYEVEQLIERASTEIGNERLEDAIRTYKEIVVVYEALPPSLKGQVHDRIIDVHRRIIETYESFRSKAASRSS